MEAQGTPLLCGVLVNLLCCLQFWACLVCWRATRCMLQLTPSGAEQHSKGSACCHMSKQVRQPLHALVTQTNIRRTQLARV